MPAALTDGRTSRRFEDPLGLMAESHHRIDRYLRDLTAVAEYGRGAALCTHDRERMEVALRYLEAAAPLHTRDEERSLFPRVRAAHGAQEQMSRAALCIDELADDLRIAGKAHAVIQRLCRRWLEAGSLSRNEAECLLDFLHDLRDLYVRHMAMEEETLFPLAARLLDRGTIAAVGSEMAARRGLDPGHLPHVSLGSMLRAASAHGTRPGGGAR